MGEPMGLLWLNYDIPQTIVYAYLISFFD